MTQEIVQHGNTKLQYTTVYDYDQHISWKRNTKGNVVARFTTHKDAKWLDMSLEESYVSDPVKGRLSSKKTFMSINEEGARALYEQLKQVFGE